MTLQFSVALFFSMHRAKRKADRVDIGSRNGGAQDVAPGSSGRGKISRVMTLQDRRDERSRIGAGAIAAFLSCIDGLVRSVLDYARPCATVQLGQGWECEGDGRREHSDGIVSASLSAGYVDLLHLDEEHSPQNPRSFLRRLDPPRPLRLVRGRLGMRRLPAQWCAGTERNCSVLPKIREWYNRSVPGDGSGT